MQKNRLSELLWWRRGDETNIRYLRVLNQRRQMSSVAEKRKKSYSFSFTAESQALVLWERANHSLGCMEGKFHFFLVWNWNPYSAFLYDSAHTAGQFYFIHWVGCGKSSPRHVLGTAHTPTRGNPANTGVGVSLESTNPEVRGRLRPAAKARPLPLPPGLPHGMTCLNSGGGSREKVEGWELAR